VLITPFSWFVASNVLAATVVTIPRTVILEVLEMPFSCFFGKRHKREMGLARSETSSPIRRRMEGFDTALFGARLASVARFPIRGAVAA
jgi:hypothetical protein